MKVCIQIKLNLYNKMQTRSYSMCVLFCYSDSDSGMPIELF